MNLINLAQLNRQCGADTENDALSEPLCERTVFHNLIAEAVNKVIKAFFLRFRGSSCSASIDVSRLSGLIAKGNALQQWCSRVFHKFQLAKNVTTEQEKNT